jgi:hypothetical protein
MLQLPVEEFEQRAQLSLQIEMHQVARKIDGTEWLPISHPEIAGIVRDLRTGRCGGSQPVRCTP